jgi:hypothetical protein
MFLCAAQRHVALRAAYIISVEKESAPSCSCDNPEWAPNNSVFSQLVSISMMRDLRFPSPEVELFASDSNAKTPSLFR